MPTRNLLRAVLFCLLLVPGCGGGGGGGGDGGDGGGDPGPVSPLLSTPSDVDFGEVAFGTEKEMGLSIRNPEPVAITIDSVTLPSVDFSLSGAAFPLTLATGQSVALSLRFVPEDVGEVDAEVRFNHSVPGGALSVPVLASSSGEEIVDFGTVSLTDGETRDLSVDVPADAISLTLEGLAKENDTIDLRYLRGPDGRLYKSGSFGDYVSRSNTEVFSTTVPNTDREELDLVPGGGTYVFRLENSTRVRPTMQVRAIIERRPAGDQKRAVMDLNVWLCLSIRPASDTAATDPRLQAILSTMDTVLSQQGIRLGDISYFDMTNLDYDFLSREEMPDMLRLTASAPERRVNLFFVQELYSSRVVGASPTISGPARNGTGSSGLAVLFDSGLSASTIGAVAAHEAGHLLGLYHTVESNGAHDIIDDTPECPAVGTNNECPRDGGGLLMHWEYLGGLLLTDGQGKVLRAHPLLAPGRVLSGAESLLLLPPLEDLPAGWCAECGR